MKVGRVLAAAAWILIAVVVLAAIFAAYQHPDFLIDFSNLVFCG
jgi:hypothetical protein